jgi:hypothetical protein
MRRYPVLVAWMVLDMSSKLRRKTSATRTRIWTRNPIPTRIQISTRSTQHVLARSAKQRDWELRSRRRGRREKGKPLPCRLSPHPRLPFPHPHLPPPRPRRRYHPLHRKHPPLKITAWTTRATRTAARTQSCRLCGLGISRRRSVSRTSPGIKRSCRGSRTILGHLKRRLRGSPRGRQGNLGRKSCV